MLTHGCKMLLFPSSGAPSTGAAPAVRFLHRFLCNNVLLLRHTIWLISFFSVFLLCSCAAMWVWCCLFPEFSTGKRFSRSFNLTRLWLLRLKPSFFPRSCFLMWPRLLAAWDSNNCYCVTLSHLARRTSTFWLCGVCSLVERNSKCMRIRLGEVGGHCDHVPQSETFR